MKNKAWMVLLVFLFGTQSYAESIWESNGKFGFGTTSPRSKVHIVGNVTLTSSYPKDDVRYSSLLLGYDSNNSEAWWVGEGTRGAKIVSLMNSIQEGSLSLGTRGTPRLMILPSGNIGVGTVYPNDMYAMTVASPGLYVVATSGSNGLMIKRTNALYHQVNFDSSVQYSNWGDRPISFTQKGAEWLRVGQNGYIGIGTKTPREALEVNGTILAQDMRFDQAQWADYVFEPDYVLMPLKDVETFIKTHGHLPNIPSEETVLKEGVSVKEMQPMLLRKIEELTLYTLQLEKRIAQLEKAAQKR